MRSGPLGAAVILLAGILLPCEAALPACPDGGEGRGATVQAAGGQVAVGHLHSHPHRAAPHHHHAAVGAVTPRLAPPAAPSVTPADPPADLPPREARRAPRDLGLPRDAAPPRHLLLCTLLS